MTDLLRGGGEPGAPARGHDWRPSPLGAPESWPPSLRSAVRLLLAARQPAAIGWGGALLQVHNDAFAATIGAEGPVRDVGELRLLCAGLWPRLEPLVERALRDGEATVLEDQLFCNFRRGYAEETYLTIACSPLADEQGGIGGVMIGLTERTEQVLSIRRTAVLRDVAAGASSVRSVLEGGRRALAAIARHPSDVPFALLYVRDTERNRMSLAATTVLAPDTRPAPATIDLRAAGQSVWPAARALATGELIVVDDLAARFGTLPAGDWPFAPRCAVVVPVTSLGRDDPDGVLVAGVSARHEPDASYRGFVDLLVKQIAAAIAAGRVHEDEARHAAARAAARLARARRRARVRALKAKFAGILEERTRLAREIHDTLLQGVAGIALQLNAVVPRVEHDPRAAARTLARIVDLAEKTSRDARDAVWDMRPPALADGDLVRAVEATARHLTVESRIAVRVTVTGRIRRLPAEHEAEALRMVQEAMANVLRHARAHTLRVRFSYGERRLRIVVADDGCGFAVEKDFRAYAGHWGLLGMQERAASLGGALLVQSAPGRGTRVSILLPYRARAPRERERVLADACPG